MDFIIQFDKQVLEWFNGLVGRSPAVDNLLIFAAQYLVLLVPIALVVGWFWASSRDNSSKIRADLIMMTVAGIFGWQVVNRIIKMFYFRERPYEGGEELKELIFHRPDESFPSDHTTLLFAIVAYCYLLGWKRTGNWALVGALMISLARITTAIHWPLDILGGFLVGTFSTFIVWNFGSWIKKIIIETLEKFKL